MDRKIFDTSKYKKSAKKCTSKLGLDSFCRKLRNLHPSFYNSLLETIEAKALPLNEFETKKVAQFKGIKYFKSKAGPGNRPGSTPLPT